MESLQSLLDRQALQDLVNWYSRAVDRGDLALLKRLYHPRAEHDHGAMFRGDREAFVVWVGQHLEELVTHHFVGNSLFALDGDRAEGEIYTINYHVLPGGWDYIAGGRYLDHYVREEGRWLFWRRRRVIDWSHERPSSASERAAGVGSGGGEDPSRTLLPLLSGGR